MALVRVAQYNSTPTVVEDYQAQNAHLQAFTNQLLTQQFILDSGTAQPVIKQGCYVSHGGSLYVANADTSITGSPSDGSVYIRVSGSTSLTVEFINDISGYTWNPVYSASTSGSYTLLPYLIVKASTVWTRYNFNQNNQSFGDTRLNSLAVLNNATVDGTLGVANNTSLGSALTVGGAISGASIGVTGNATVGGTLGVTGAISGASVTSSGAVQASAAQGFISKDYVPGARNPIWNFDGASSQYGMSYFQGASGMDNADTIGMHFGNATAADSKFKFIDGGNLQCTSVDTGTLGFASLNPDNSTETSIQLSAGSSYMLPKGAYAIKIETTSVSVACQMYHDSSWITIFGGTGGFVISDGVNFRLSHTGGSGTFDIRIRKW